MFNNITLRTLSTAIDNQFETTTTYIDNNFVNNTTLTTLSTAIDNQF
jgi:Flp pilus assembly pilin Flp